MSYKSLLIGAALTASFCLGMWVHSKLPKNAPQTIFIERVDTCTIRDTIVREKPVYVAKKTIDTMYIPVTDTLRIKDSVFVALPMEQKEYRENDYYARISGYQPSLDYIEVYKEKQVITEHIVRKTHWGIGLSAGYAVGYNGKVVGTPYLGIGINYNLYSW